MKKLLLILCIAAASASCIDKDYDISNVNTDNVTIGGDGSIYKMPLAKVTISMSQVGNQNLDIESIFKEADVWLPSPLPGGAPSVDLTKLKPGTPYTQTMIDALIDQMIRDEQKLDDVTNLIWTEYKANFLPLLPSIVDPDDEVEFKAVFKIMFVMNDELQEAARNLAQDYLFEMRIDPLDYEIGSIDLDDSVVDMLAQNLDPESVTNPKNTLHLKGEIKSELPAGMGLTPSFTNTNVMFEIAVAPDESCAIPDTRIFEADLRQIIKGANIHIPVTLLSYFPDKKFAETQKITLQLSLVKRGGLTLDF